MGTGRVGAGVGLDLGGAGLLVQKISLPFSELLFQDLRWMLTESRFHPSCFERLYSLASDFKIIDRV